MQPLQHNSTVSPSDLDPIDKEILRLLQVNGKLTARELGQQIGLSTTPTYERLKKLEQSGVMKQVVALMDRESLGTKIVAFCNVSLQPHALQVMTCFESSVKEIPEVMECYHITGNYDYLLKVAVADMNAYQRFLTQKLAVLDHVAQVQSNFVMTEVKYSTAYEIS